MLYIYGGGFNSSTPQDTIRGSVKAVAVLCYNAVKDTNEEGDTMKPKHVRFCQLVARGDLTQAEAYLASGYKSKHPEDSASRLMARPEIKAKVLELQKKHAVSTTTDAEWIREQLKNVVDKSSSAIEVMEKVDGEMQGTGEFKYDSSGVNKALDTLNRMNGGYEKDNTQKQPNINLDMKF